MARNDNDERLTRSEQHFVDVRAFLDSDANSMKLILYGSEISRLSKEFPQITIVKGDLYKPNLYTCTVKRK